MAECGAGTMKTDDGSGPGIISALDTDSSLYKLYEDFRGSVRLI